MIDLEQFDNSSDQAFVDRLYIPGLRRAGDFQTAIAMAGGPVIVHNAANRFKLEAARVLPSKLSPAEIVALLR